MNPDQEPKGEPDNFCVSYRCRLCRFPIRVGETVVADAGDGKLTSSFPFEHNAHYDDLHLVLQACHLTCPHDDDDDDEQLPAYHVGCLRHAPPLTKDGLRVTEYTYEPTVFEDPRRASRIRDAAGRRLQMECPFLPAEVCLLITEELVRECAATATHHMLQGRNLQALDFNLDVSLSVWARYTYIDGIRYIESLSNMGDSQSVLVLDADRPPVAELLYVLQDHLGIRQVVFASYEHSLKLSALLSKPKNDAWWQTIPITQRRFIAKSDGLKLRFLYAPGRLGFDPKTVTWPKPMPPYQEPMFSASTSDVMTKAMPDPFRTYYRILSVEFNDPTITGYSICWESGIRGIYPHHKREKLTAYNDFDLCEEPPTWIYIPMVPGERITGIWTRMSDDSSSTGIMFQTNRGKMVVAGHCEEDNNERLDDPSYWGELCNVSDKRFRVHYELSNRGMEKLVAQALSGRDLSYSGDDVPPPCPSLRYGAPKYCHYSSVSLENVVRIIPCRVKLNPLGTPYWAITGILVRYADGSQECAGEFRLDCAGEPINFDGPCFLNLAYVKKTESNYWYLDGIYPESGDREGVTWWTLPKEGLLQWWFSDRKQCRIAWIDQTGGMSHPV